MVASGRLRLVSKIILGRKILRLNRPNAFLAFLGLFEGVVRLHLSGFCNRPMASLCDILRFRQISSYLTIPCIPAMKTDNRDDAKNNSCAEIIPGLWIGSLASLRAIDAVTHVGRQWRVISLLGSERLISLSRVLISSSMTLVGCDHEIWKLSDTFQGDFMSDRLESILRLIDEYIPSMIPDDGRANRACLVHCAQGVSRSAAVCAAWLISRKSMSLEDALNRIRHVRHEISPNLGFLASLRALEQCDGNVKEAVQRMRESKNRLSCVSKINHRLATDR